MSLMMLEMMTTIVAVAVTVVSRAMVEYEWLIGICHVMMMMMIAVMVRWR